MIAEGDMALTPLAQADGQAKARPVLVLKRMPPFGDLLVCGVSTQLQHEVVDFDDVIAPSHEDFHLSGLKSASLIRLGYLAVIPGRRFFGAIGSVSTERRLRLLSRLVRHLQA